MIDAVTADELRRILGDIEDARVIEILAMTPTVAELEEAAYRAAGESDRLASLGAPGERVARIYDILMRDVNEFDDR
jgi:hypothetical protein